MSRPEQFVKCFLLAAIFSNVACAADTNGAVKHVVLVSVDGLAASYFDEPRAEMPFLRELARQGVRAEGMLTTFPSVTWPSHTSLVTGATPRRHGVLGNSTFDARAQREVVYIGDPVLEKDQAIRIPTLYDVAHQRGLSCGSVLWPCCNGASSLKWVIPDSNKPSLHERYTTPGLVEELAQAGIDISKLGEWGWNKQHATARDELYTATAKYLLSRHGVNLLLVHLITPDGVEHAYGPHTPEAYAAVAQSDAHLKQIWQTLQQPPLRGHSALFVVSDHGFASVEQLIRPNVLFHRQGWLELDENQRPLRRKVWCQSQGGSAFVYVLDDSQRDALLGQLKPLLKALPGVAALLEPEQYTALGLPSPGENPESPHLVLAAQPGYAFDNAVTGEITNPSTSLKGTHGHLPEPPSMHATFVAAGAGLKAGVKLPVIRNIDVAPTIAHLLGLELPSAEGRVLHEILAH